LLTLPPIQSQFMQCKSFFCFCSKYSSKDHPIFFSTYFSQFFLHLCKEYETMIQFIFIRREEIQVWKASKTIYKHSQIYFVKENWHDEQSTHLFCLNYEFTCERRSCFKNENEIRNDNHKEKIKMMKKLFTKSSYVFENINYFVFEIEEFS
jgi:hypothetical protein